MRYKKHLSYTLCYLIDKNIDLTPIKRLKDTMWIIADNLKRYAIANDTTSVIGRDPSAKIQLPQTNTASRNHALLSITENTLYLMDSKSKVSTKYTICSNYKQP